jgi:putative ABC transport system permease protein
VKQPSPWADWLLRHTLPPGVDGDTIRGDLVEELDARGPWWYWRQTVSLAIRYGWRRKHIPEGNTMALDNLWQDARYAIRGYLKAPLFTLIVLTTLALGIGASTAIFSLVNGILLRPLPFPDPDRLVFVDEVRTSGDHMSVSWPNFLDWRARQHVFASLAASRSELQMLTGRDEPRRLLGRRVTGNFFSTLRVAMASGRSFSDADDQPGASPAAIVSAQFWKNDLGSASDVLGKVIVLNGVAHTIVGVLPPDFKYGQPYSVFVPMGAVAAARDLLDRGNHEGYFGLGRLKPGVTLDAAERDLRAIAGGLERQYPNTNSGVGVKAELLLSRTVSEVRLTLYVLLGAVGFLLLIACANVANLLIARGTARQHELAVRAALGGARRRLASQLLVESTIVSLAGGAVGVAVAAALLRLLVRFAPEGTPRIDDVRLDGMALLFAFAAASACGIAFGAFPALQASSITGQQVVVRGRSSGASARSHRVRRGLMIVEVALAVVLLTGAGLMMRTLQQLTRVDAGFRPDHLLTVRASLAGPHWDQRPPRAAFYDQLLARLGAIPGVQRAGIASRLPIDGSDWNSIFIVSGKPIPPRAELPSSAFTPASPGYLEALGTRLVRGRLPDSRDTATSASTIVVNETLARKMWPGEDPIGQQLKQGWPEWKTPWREVVGVVADVKFEGIAEPTPMQVYLPIDQAPPSDFAIAVRTAGDPNAVRSAVEAAVHALDRDIPTYSVRTMDQLVESSTARERMSALVLLVFAAVALLLASIGLYGVVSHGVTERTHEIGVRMALGAETAHVLRLVVGHGLATTLAGIAIGLAAALALSRAIQGLLFGVSATDPLTLGAVIAVLMGVAIVACYLPARRAIRLDPTLALRSD